MAVHDLANGWSELAQHWWSALAAAGVLGALAGLGVTLLTPRGRRAAPTDSPN
jgi:membrane-associated phospholipid phosphatase